jgi:quinol monooxygenase YgiN
MIKHIVMWKLKDPTKAGFFKAQLDSCKGIVPGMKEFEAAVQTDGLDANQDVALYSVFDDAAALQAYIVHPHHKEVVATLKTLAESRSALDYQIN